MSREQWLYRLPPNWEIEPQLRRFRRTKLPTAVFAIVHWQASPEGYGSWLAEVIDYGRLCAGAPEDPTLVEAIAWCEEQIAGIVERRAKR